MQPKTETGGELRANGLAPSAVPADIPDARLNGGSSAELHDLLHALQAMRVGDFSVRMAGSQVGLLGKVADTFNEIVAANERMAHHHRAARPRARAADGERVEAVRCRCLRSATGRGEGAGG
jgi:hypothetical protein